MFFLSNYVAPWQQLRQKTVAFRIAVNTFVARQLILQDILSRDRIFLILALAKGYKIRYQQKRAGDIKEWHDTRKL